MRRKNNYVMPRLNVPKRVALPNCRTFLARYKHVPRSELPPKIVMRRTYRQRAAPWGRRRRQRGRGVFSFIKKVAKNLIFRQLAKTGLQYLPQVYDAATSRVKNDKVRKILQSDTARGLLDNAIKRYQ